MHAQAADSAEDAPSQSYAFADFADHEEEIERLSLQATVVASLEFPALEEAGLRDGLTVLDLGSGPGVLSAALTRRFPAVNVVGVEPEPSLRETAEALAVRQGTAERCQFVHGTAQRIPLPADSVDFAYARLLFQHLGEPEIALRELARVVRPGGVVCVMDADDGSIMIHPPVPEWERLEPAIREVQAGMGGDRLVGRKLQGLLAGVGLEGVMVQQLHVTPQSIGAGPFFEIGFGFKRELLSRGSLWDERAQATFEHLKRHVAEPTTYATYAGFVAHGLVPGG